MTLFIKIQKVFIVSLKYAVICLFVCWFLFQGAFKPCCTTTQVCIQFKFVGNFLVFWKRGCFCYYFCVEGLIKSIYFIENKTKPLKYNSNFYLIIYQQTRKFYVTISQKNIFVFHIRKFEGKTGDWMIINGKL